VLHAVGEEGVAIREVAEVIGRHLDLPLTAVSPEGAAEHFGFLAPLVGLDSPASSALTQAQMRWQPTHPGLIDDLESGFYF
ncbi:MAG: 3-beta hydroxysteroid dehydrogenase, partial [Candidatus Dormibacteria bacterium]